MTDRLDDKIRSLMVQVVEASPAAQELEDIMELRLSTEPNLPINPLLPRVDLQPRRRWLVAVASAAAVLVLVGGAALLLRATGSDSPVATSPKIESLSTLAWSRVPYDEAVFGKEFEQAMSSVTVGGPGLVAVGGAGTDAAVWTSPDGVTWSRVPNDGAVFTRAGMSSVTAWGLGLVAVGQDEPNAAVWTSPDGVTWSRVPHDEAVFGGEVGSICGGAGMSSVTVGGPGLVAVGSDGSPDCDGGSDAAVWTSVDGVTWSRVPHDEVVFGGETDGYYGQSMSSVTAGGPGLVAVGSDVGRAAVWTSRDGVTWSRVPHDEAVFAGSGMNSVAVGGPGLVAVGQAQNTAAVWTSPDGIAWSRVPHDEVVFGGGTDTDNDVEISSVTAGAEGLLAVGSDPDREGVAVWTSVDGLTWFRIPHDEAVFGVTPDRPHMHMSSVTAGGPGFVAVGGHGVRPTFGPTNNDAVVWVAVPGE
jgi:hypothetical protein